MVRRIARNIFGGGLALAIALLSVPPSHAATGRAARQVALPQHQASPLKQLQSLPGDSAGVFRAADASSAPSQSAPPTSSSVKPITTDGDTRGAGMMIDPNGSTR